MGVDELLWSTLSTSTNLVDDGTRFVSEMSFNLLLTAGAWPGLNHVKNSSLQCVPRCFGGIEETLGHATGCCMLGAMSGGVQSIKGKRATAKRRIHSDRIIFASAPASAHRSGSRVRTARHGILHWTSVMLEWELEATSPHRRRDQEHCPVAIAAKSIC